MLGCNRPGEESQGKRHRVMRYQRLVSRSISRVIALCRPQELDQLVQSMTQDTTLHQVGIFGQIKHGNPPVLGDEF
jgi:hypothetical protein